MRNFFLTLGVVAVFGMFFLFIRPDWMRQISSTPSSPASAVATKVNARLAGERLNSKQLSKDKGGLFVIDAATNGEDLSTKIVEDVGDDLPSRNAPYLLVINKTDHSMRYCRLSTSVRKVSLRGTAPVDVKFQEVSNTSGGPYQVIIWVPAAIDVPLEIELLLGIPPRS